MRSRLLIGSLALLLAGQASGGAVASAGGAGGSGGSDGSGGAEYGQPVTPAPAGAPRVAGFAAAPATLRPGADGVRFSFRVTGRSRVVRVRIDVLPAAGGRLVRRLAVGRRPTGRRLSFGWAPGAGEIEPGRYVARLHAVDAEGRVLARAAGASGRLRLRVVAPAVAAPPAPATLPFAPTGAGVFPVQGPWSFGGADGHFGAGRTGHTHQGQDIVAAEGVPIVAPRAGVIASRAFQARGAGHYLVLHSADARDYVFMHLLEGSPTVGPGDAVAAGQPIGAVGSSGASSGPHLHFEIWPGGWHASDTSQPIDPLPDLQAWAGQG